MVFGNSRTIAVVWEQEAQRLALGRELAVDMLCALANNNSRCYDESLEFAEHLERILPSAEQVSAASV